MCSSDLWGCRVFLRRTAAGKSFSPISPIIGGEKAPINDDLVFEIELVKQVQVNVDYIIRLVEEQPVMI